MGVPDHLNMLPEKPVGRSRNDSYNQTRNSLVQKIGKGCIMSTSVQSTSHEVLGWMNHKLESRLPEEMSTTSDMQMILV